MTTIQQQLIGMHKHVAAQIGGDGMDENGVLGLVKRFVNNDVVALDDGDVVALDLTSDTAVVRASTEADPAVVGVVAATGPFAVGALVPVMIMGWHSRVKVTGAVSRGDYLRTSTGVGTAEKQDPPDAAGFARATTVSASGRVSAVIFEPEVGGGSSGGGATALEYNPALAPASPSAFDDEFNDLALAPVWTQQDSGAGTRVISETQRRGFLYVSMTDGGAGTNTGVYKSYAPGAVALTVVTRLFGHVGAAGSNQVNLGLYDAAGAVIYYVGKLNGASNFIVGDSGAFRTYNVPTNVVGNVGETWLMIQRDASTNYAAYVSGDGHVWHRLEGANRSGTVGRLKLQANAFSSSNTHAYYDFVRTFPSQTFYVGEVGAVGGGGGGGGGASYNDEMAQDAVGGILFDTAEVDLAYDDDVPSISASLRNNSIAPTRLTLPTGTLVGRSTAGAGAGESISVGAGLALAAGVLSSTVTQYTDTMARNAVGGIFVDSAHIDFVYNAGTPSITATVNAASLTPSRLLVNNGTIIGRQTAGAGAGEEIIVGTGLTFVGGFLAVTTPFAGFANPTATVGLAAVNGAATTAMRSDAAPALSQAIVPTWSGMHTWTARTARTGTLAPTGVGNDYIHHYSDQTIAPLTNDNQYHQWFAPEFAPASGRTIPTAIVQQVRLRTGSAAGSITAMAGLFVDASYGTQKPTTTVFGISVANIGTTGVGQTQAINVKAQTGTGAFAITSEGGENRMVGATVFNHLASAIAPIQLTGTIPTPYGYLGEATYTYGGGVQVRPVWVTSTIAPSSNLNFGNGGTFTPLFAPPTGVTITNARVLHAGIVTGSTGGAISIANGLTITASYGSVIPANVYGITIPNLGVPGMTNVYGIYLDPQMNGTTNVGIYNGGTSRLVGNVMIGGNGAGSNFPLTVSQTVINSNFGNMAVIGGTHAASVNLGAAHGMLVSVVFSPDPGITIGSAINNYYFASTGNSGGTITALYNLYILPNYGSIKPQSAYGMYINNHGAVGMTTAAGLHIDAQTGAANNFDMSFSRYDPAVGTSAAIARIPINVGGGLAYFRVYPN